MSDTPNGVGNGDDRSRRGTSATAREEALNAARALSAIGDPLQWGLLSLGFLVGIGRVQPTMTGSGSPSVIGFIANLVGCIVAFGLMGRVAAVSCRLVAALILVRIERGEDTINRLIAQAVRGVDLLERLVEVSGSMGARTAPVDDIEVRRAVSLAEIERALGSERWDETESLLDSFGRAFPEDATLAALSDRLDAGRRRALEGQIAELDAARQVNDPPRVMELYRGIVPSLDVDRREEMARDLAKWFLEVIHRRLRTGKIQPEVVSLATQVAETFGATVEGASMRAALPTLRRSVGLCPRCAQPYTGTAVACPQCAAGAVASPPTETPPVAS